MLPTYMILAIASLLMLFVSHSDSLSLNRFVPKAMNSPVYNVPTHHNNIATTMTLSTYSPIGYRSVSIRKSFLNMAASRGGGSTKLDRKTVTQTKPTYREEIEKDWRLILHDDSVHTIQQVCEILSKTCPLCSGSRAYEVTLQVHMTGAATVAVANKKIVDEYSKSLQMAGLTVSTAPDEDFEPEE